MFLETEVPDRLVENSGTSLMLNLSALGLGAPGPEDLCIRELFPC